MKKFPSIKRHAAWGMKLKRISRELVDMSLEFERFYGHKHQLTRKIHLFAKRSMALRVAMDKKMLKERPRATIEEKAMLAGVYYGMRVDSGDDGGQ